MCCYTFLLRELFFYQLGYIIFFGVDTNYTKYDIQRRLLFGLKLPNLTTIYVDSRHAYLTHWW